jgi:transposase
VVVAKTRTLHSLSDRKAITDRRSAATLARLLEAGMLAPVWVPDEQTRALRRRIARRAQLVRQRTRAKNEIHRAGAQPQAPTGLRRLRSRRAALARGARVARR